MPDNQNRIVPRDWSRNYRLSGGSVLRRLDHRLLGGSRSLRWRLGTSGSRRGDGTEKADGNELNAHEIRVSLQRVGRKGARQALLQGRFAAEVHVEAIRTERRYDAQGEVRRKEAGAEMAKKRRKCLTRRTKSEILSALEVSYVPSSPPYDADFCEPAPLRSSPRSSIPTFLP